MKTLLVFITLILFAPGSHSQTAFVPIATNMAARAISGNGSIVIGTGGAFGHMRPFRWAGPGQLLTEELMPPLSNPLSQYQNATANGVSSDGLIIVGGYAMDDPSLNAFRWEPETGGVVGAFRTTYSGVSSDGAHTVGTRQVDGMSPPVAVRDDVSLGVLITNVYIGWFDSYGKAISDDGSVCVGTTARQIGTNLVVSQAFRWKEGSGMTGLGSIAADQSSAGNNISGNGLVVVGNSGSQAFRWTEAEGMVGLGDLEGGTFSSDARGANWDGSIIVGRATSEQGSEAFIWDATNGIRSLTTVLQQAGADLAGCRLTEAVGVSSNGLCLAGNGVNAYGQAIAWFASLSVDDIPRIAAVLDFPNIRLSWPTNPPGLSMLSTDDGKLTQWVPVTNAPAISNDQNWISMPLEPGNRFFRLVR